MSQPYPENEQTTDAQLFQATRPAPSTDSSLSVSEDDTATAEPTTEFTSTLAQPDYLAFSSAPMYPATAAAMQSPLYTADGTHTGKRPTPPRGMSVPMMLLGVAVIVAAIAGIADTPSADLMIVILFPIVLVLAVVTLLTLRRK